MIVVIAAIEVVPDRRDEFVRAFKELVPKVHAEDGCIEYGPHVDVPTNIDAQSDLRGNTVTIVEKWESVGALERHLVAPHMNEYREQVSDLVKKVSLQILEPA